MPSVRHAARQIARRPALSVVVIAMLAIGIGATAGIYSIWYTVLIRPLPVPEPGRLVNLVSFGPKPGMRSNDRAGRFESIFSYPMFRDMEGSQQVLAGLAGHRSFDANIAMKDESISGTGMLVSGEYFSVLRLTPALGRLIGPGDDVRASQSAVAVLAYDHWHDYFGADPGVIGDTITVNGQVLTVIGVAPPGFNGTTIGLRPRVFVPLTLRWLMEPIRPQDAGNRRSYWVYMFGRLADGTDLIQAGLGINNLYRAIINETEASLNSELPDDLNRQFLEQTMELVPGARGQSDVHRTAKPALMLLLGVTSLVLVIVCVNIASLLLASGESRTTEAAVRSSIGATRWQLLKQFLLESSLLAFLGGITSLPVAAATIAVFVVLLPASESVSVHLELEPSAYAFIAAVSIVTVLIFGLYPALRSSSVRCGALVAAAGQRATSSRTVMRIRASVTTGQIAVSVLLLAVAGLFVQSLLEISRVDLGMDVDSVVAFTVSPGLNGYGLRQVDSLFDAIEASLDQQAGVRGVGSSDIELLTSSGSGGFVNVENHPDGPNVDTFVRRNLIGADFFSTLSIPLQGGRGILATDVHDAPAVAVVNETFVRKFDLGTDAIGTRFALDRESQPDIEIVGIVADAKYSDVKSVVPPVIYLPWRQATHLQSLTYYVRSELASDLLMQNITRTVATIDPTLPVENMSTLSRVVEENIFQDRIISKLSAGLAVLATALAALGLYSLLACGVATRARELALRLALGATPTSVQLDVFAGVLRMAAAGSGAGIVLAVVIGRVAHSMLYEVNTVDPTALLGALGIISIVVAAAGYIPARRAALTAPMEALRHE